ncbi:MAG: asparagine synthase-related protein, partial [Chloroflexota bacterium]|nr:asparagine synthase-related protein [Chloroflexota bacterium]
RKQLYGLWRYYAYLGNIPYRLHRARHLLRGAAKFGGKDYLSPQSQRLHLDTNEILDWKRQRGVPRWWASKRYMLTQAREDVGLPAYLRHRAGLVGLTGRPPLFDVDLLDFALRIPPEHEFDPHMDRPLIREAMKGRVPDEVRLSKRKSNLGPWYVDVLTGSDLEPIRRLLHAEKPEIAAYTRIEPVRKMAEGPPPPGGGSKLGWMSDLWRLTAAECWLQYEQDPTWIDRFTAENALPSPVFEVHRQHAAAPSRVLSA